MFTMFGDRRPYGLCKPSILRLEMRSPDNMVMTTRATACWQSWNPGALTPVTPNGITRVTAFAPNTTGIPYYKNGKSCSMEIAKQLYDVGRLFENVSDLQITSQAFRKIAAVELSYRSLGTDAGPVFNDIRQTALCISTRGKAGEGDFNLMQDGIIRVKSFMYKQRYLIDNAIIDAARAAYLATLIEKGVTRVEPYPENPNDIKDLVIRTSLTNKLNKLKSNLPEAYYYWAKTSELLES